MVTSKKQFRNDESPSFEATLNYNDPITPRTDVLLPRTSLHQQSGPDARISRQVSWRPADLQGDVLLPRTSLHQKSGPSAGFGETSFTWTVVDAWGFSDAVIGFDSANGTLAGWAETHMSFDIKGLARSTGDCETVGASQDRTH